MSQKHPDRTIEWAKQQQALKNPKTIPVLIHKKTKDDKKATQ
ncbi:hypothetical protein [Pelosinus baikalensis]|nr:hypothetical protein [Pelosinus baikalensis]